MASCKNFSSMLMDLLRNPSFLTPFLFFPLVFLISYTFTNHSPSIAATSIASRLLSSSNYLSSFSTVNSLNTHFEIDYSSPDAVRKISSCNIFDGRWVVDDDYLGPMYDPGSCPYVDEAFNCFKNGRTDSDYLKLRWKPHGCEIPRFNGRKMLHILQGKRLVFVGDSLNRNMWEALVCSLREALSDKQRVIEASGKREFRTERFYSFRFEDYNCSIDFIRAPFLVQENRTSEMFSTLRLDMINDFSDKYQNADMIIFNTGHWWNHQKTYKSKNFFQEGDHVYKKLPVKTAYTKALLTWARWVDSQIDPNRTKVFFRGFSASHFKGGQWNSGGNCDGEKTPILNESFLAPYPWMMTTLESVISKMKTPVTYLNITKMTDFRKDGHPSIFRLPQNQRTPWTVQDCSHWCLPGVPDSWNELLYTSLLLSNHT